MIKKLINWLKKLFSKKTEPEQTFDGWIKDDADPRDYIYGGKE